MINRSGTEIKLLKDIQWYKSGFIGEEKWES